jgi:ferrous iron transport protein B
MSTVNMNAYIALVGPPNSGKTTLFNWLTGHFQKVVNYPGSTVDVAIGETLLVYGASLKIIDTPGTYSLFPKSQDEEVTQATLFSEQFQIRRVILVLDSTQISRQIHLVRQLQEAGFAVVVAVTMHDLHTREGGDVDIKLMAQRLNVSVCPIDGVLGGGVKELVKAAAALPAVTTTPQKLSPWPIEKMQRVFKEGDALAKDVVKKELLVYSQTEELDRIFLHPIYGLVLFILIMFSLFTSIYWLAQPLMDAVDAAFTGLANLTLAHIHWGLFSDFIASGLIGGLGSVLVFVPQIFILFLGISMLEDTGYLSRAATLADKPLAFFGLNGKAFVPILSGFACAVPAIMAVRSINSKRERWLATFIIPFMTCSARLPVYALLLGFLFPHTAWVAGLCLAALYLGGLAVGLISAGLLNKLVKTKTPTYFALELPLYRRPKLAVVLRNSLRRTKSYVTKTAPIILVLSVCVWGATTFPNYQASEAKTRLETSYASHVGQILEPIFKPMGVDWRVGVGLMSAFAARETFVSSLAVLFNAGDTNNKEAMRSSMIEKMRDAKFADGTAIFNLRSVVALLVFFMLAMQCMSTSSVVFRETSSWAFVFVQIIAMNLLAYGFATLTHALI